MKLLLKKINTWTHDRKQMWLPDAHLCFFILSAARPCVAVLLHGAATSSAISPQMHQQNPADAPPESRGTTRIRRTPTESCLHLQRDFGGVCISFHWAKRCRKPVVHSHRQNKPSAQLPQPTRSQTGKPEEVEFRLQSHLVSWSDNLSIVKDRDILSRVSYQPIVLASLWWHLWWTSVIRAT